METHYDRLLDAAAHAVRASLQEMMEETDTTQVVVPEDLLRDMSEVSLAFFLTMN